MGPVGQRMPEPSFRYDGRTMVRYQGHLQIELLLSFTSYPQSLSGEHIPEDSLPCQQVVEISENIMQLPESTPDISIEINGCIVRVHGDISEALLEKTVRVLSHVK